MLGQLGVDCCSFAGQVCGGLHACLVHPADSLVKNWVSTAAPCTRKVMVRALGQQTSALLVAPVEQVQVDCHWFRGIGHGGLDWQRCSVLAASFLELSSELIATCCCHTRTCHVGQRTRMRPRCSIGLLSELTPSLPPFTSRSSPPPAYHPRTCHAHQSMRMRPRSSSTCCLS